MKYKKHTVREMKIEETTIESTIISYDCILNKIQELEKQLDYYSNLKIEADKLKLIR